MKQIKNTIGDDFFGFLISNFDTEYTQTHVSILTDEMMYITEVEAVIEVENKFIND